MGLDQQVTYITEWSAANVMYETIFPVRFTHQHASTDF